MLFEIRNYHFDPDLFTVRHTRRGRQPRPSRTFRRNLMSLGSGSKQTIRQR